MYEHLKGKTLMVMDRTALAACAVKRAKEMGIRTVVANFYKTEDSPSKQIADVAIDVDISDIDEMVRLIAGDQYRITAVSQAQENNDVLEAEMDALRAAGSAYFD